MSLPDNAPQNKRGEVVSAHSEETYMDITTLLVILLILILLGGGWFGRGRWY